MSLHKVCQLLYLLFLVLGSAHVVVLIWSGIENVIVWKSLGTLLILFAVSLVAIAIHSGSVPQLGWESRPQTKPITEGAKEDDTPGQVTYVFDRGLIRFVKFTGSILAIFLIV